MSAAPPIGFTQAQATAVIATGRWIEQSGPRLLQLAAGLTAAGLALVPLHHRRLVATAVAELALRRVAPPAAAANQETPQA
jgi:predicted DNA-binding transcriptional regulator YafY